MARETAAEKAEREAAEADAAAVAAAAAGSDVASSDDAKGTKVRVPDDVGREITFSRGGEVVLTKTVRDGIVTADDDAELAVLLGSVPGAQLVD